MSGLQGSWASIVVALVRSVVAALVLWSGGLPVVVMHKLSCLVARGLFTNRSEPLSPCTGRQIVNHKTARGSPAEQPLASLAL